MAGAKHGKVFTFKADDSGGVLRDLTTYTDNVNFPMTADTAESTTAGLTAKTYVVGYRDATITATGKYDSTATTGPDVTLSSLLGVGPFSIEYQPGGVATGEVKYACEAILTNYTPSSPVGGVVAWSAAWQVSGVVTRTVNP